MIRPTPVATVLHGTEPSSKRGTMTLSMTQRIAPLLATVHRANTEAPATATANGRGCSRMRLTSIPADSRARAKRRESGAVTTSDVSTGCRPGTVSAFRRGAGCRRRAGSVPP